MLKQKDSPSVVEVDCRYEFMMIQREVNETLVCCHFDSSRGIELPL